MSPWPNLKTKSMIREDNLFINKRSDFEILGFILRSRVCCKFTSKIIHRLIERGGEDCFSIRRFLNKHEWMF